MSENTNLLNVSENEKFITNYKAVYQAMTAKHDCKSKIFPRKVRVNLDDIIDLNDRVTDKLRNYQEAGFTISATASFVGHKTIEFSTWQEFINHKWTESSAINSVTIIWEFNAVLPQYGVPQKHVLVVKIADGLKPEEMLNVVFAGKLENIEEIEKQMYPVVARVDFINYVLGDELLNIVEEWDNGLEAQESEEYIFPKFCVRNRRKFAYVLNYATNIITLVCCIKIVIYFLKSYGAATISELTIPNLSQIIWVSGFLILGYIFINKISQWLANIFYKVLGKETMTHVFCLNKGDRNIQKRIDKELRKSKIYVLSSVIGTFILNLICSVICTIIVK